MEKLLIQALLSYGIFTIGQSKIFTWWRGFLSWFHPWAIYLWNCSVCLGFWLGMGLNLLDLAYFNDSKHIVFDGVLSSIGCALIHTIICRISNNGLTHDERN